jgi:GH43 family beta-xylosidase
MSQLSIIALLLLIFEFLFGILLCEEFDSGRGVFYNPIFEDGYLSPDPFVYYHTDGFYYYSRSTGNDIMIFKSSTLTNFRNAVNETVYHCPPAYCGSLWAPEIHFIQNNFYIYFTMENGTALGHRMFVIQALDNANPLGQYSEEIR